MCPHFRYQTTLDLKTRISCESFDQRTDETESDEALLFHLVITYLIIFSLSVFAVFSIAVFFIPVNSTKLEAGCCKLNCLLMQLFTGFTFAAAAAVKQQSTNIFYQKIL